MRQIISLIRLILCLLEGVLLAGCTINCNHVKVENNYLLVLPSGRPDEGLQTDSSDLKIVKFKRVPREDLNRSELIEGNVKK